jgi:hypothetical protein
MGAFEIVANVIARALPEAIQKYLKIGLLRRSSSQ